MPHINPEKMLDVLEGLLNLVAHCESLSRNQELSDSLADLADRIQDIVQTILHAYYPTVKIDDRVPRDQEV